MKAKFLIGIALSVFIAQAIAGDTYPTLTTLDGETFKNVEVASHTGSYLILLYDGGGKKVPFTNLPPDIQLKYHFDAGASAKAEQIAAEKRAKAAVAGRTAMAEAQKEAAWTGTPNRVRIIKTLAANQYEIATGDLGHIVVAMPSLPYERRSFIEKIGALRAALDPRQQGDRRHVANSTLVLVDQQNNDRRQQLEQMASLEPRMVYVMAGETKLSYAGAPVWRYLGQAPINPPIR